MANLDDNPAELRERINSAADLFLYLDIAEYQGRSGDTHVQDGNITWHHNNPVNITIKDKRANCGGAANLAMYLLEMIMKKWDTFITEGKTEAT